MSRIFCEQQGRQDTRETRGRLSLIFTFFRLPPPQYIETYKYEAKKPLKGPIGLSTSPLERHVLYWVHYSKNYRSLLRVHLWYHCNRNDPCRLILDRIIRLSAMLLTRMQMKECWITCDAYPGPNQAVVLQVLTAIATNTSLEILIIKDKDDGYLGGANDCVGIRRVFSLSIHLWKTFAPPCLVVIWGVPLIFKFLVQIWKHWPYTLSVTTMILALIKS